MEIVTSIDLITIFYQVQKGVKRIRFKTKGKNICNRIMLQTEFWGTIYLVNSRQIIFVNWELFLCCVSNEITTSQISDIALLKVCHFIYLCT